MAKGDRLYSTRKMNEWSLLPVATASRTTERAFLWAPQQVHLISFLKIIYSTSNQLPFFSSVINYKRRFTSYYQPVLSSSSWDMTNHLYPNESLLSWNVKFHESRQAMLITDPVADRFTHLERLARTSSGDGDSFSFS